MTMALFHQGLNAGFENLHVSADKIEGHPWVVYKCVQLLRQPKVKSLRAKK